MSMQENKYGMLETQQMLLDIMLEIDRVCRENGISYSLLGGTMLGAVREKGFIPWDDDADLVFTAEALQKFIQVFPEQSKDYTVSLTDTWVARAVSRQEINGQRPFVDLFHYESCKPGFAFKMKLMLLKVLQGMLKQDTDYSAYSAFNRILLKGTNLLGKLFPRETKLRWYAWVSANMAKGDGSLVHIPDECFHCLKITYSGECTGHFADVTFEDKRLMMSTKAHEMLTAQYGDYLTPPPEEERIPNHVRQREKKG